MSRDVGNICEEIKNGKTTRGRISELFFHVTVFFFFVSHSARSPSWLSTCNPLASVSPEHRAQRHGDHHHHTWLRSLFSLGAPER